MGLRDRFKKGGGGFLNNVTITVQALEFTSTPPGDGSAPKSGDFTPLFAKLTARVDGGDAPVETHLFAGSADDFEISEDGRTLTPIDGASLWGGTAFARFYNSAVEHGLEDPDTDEGEPLDFSHVVNKRFAVAQVKDEEAMARAAKNAAKSKGKINAQGQRKGKDGKFYDIRTLEVTEYFGEAEAPAKNASKKAAPAATKTSGKAAPAAPKGKTAAKPAAADGEELRAFAKDVVIGVLEQAKDNKLVRTSLSTGIIKLFNNEYKGDDRRELVRKIAGDEEFIAEMVEEGLITFEKNTLALAG